MENSTDNFAKTGEGSADKARSAIRSAQTTATDTANRLSSKLDDVRSEAGTVVSRSSKRLQSASKQGMDAITEMAGQARDIASNATDSIVAYTKKNPVKALAMAAASGALLYVIVKALTPSRD